MKMKKLIICIVIVSSVLIQKSYSAEWKYLGLDSHIVNCMLIVNINRRLFGTSTTLYFKGMYSWQDFPTVNSSSINSILSLNSSSDVIVAAGYDSPTAGIYRGMDILDGEPYFDFRLATPILLQNPQSMTVKGDTSGDTIYVGHQNNISYFTIKKISSTMLKPLKTPEECFGKEQPHCAALHVFSKDKRLYAGGYDWGQEPGQGSLLFLENDEADSLHTLRRLNVTAITEVFTESQGFKLYIGTRDSGIFSFSDPLAKIPWDHIPSPNNEPVDAMISIPTLVMSQMLCVSVISGVYIRSGKSWYRLGNLQGATCLSLGTGPSEVMYAGTGEGVFVLDSLTVPINHSPGNKQVPEINMFIKNQGNEVSVAFSMNKSQKVQIDIITLSGKTIATPVSSNFTAGKHVLSLGQNNLQDYKYSNGVYLIKLSTGGKSISKKFILMF